MTFVTNFLLSLTVKEFWKSVNIWWSYGQELGVFSVVYVDDKLQFTIMICTPIQFFSKFVQHSFVGTVNGAAKWWDLICGPYFYSILFVNKPDKYLTVQNVSIVLVNRKKKHRKSAELKNLQAKEVLLAGESVEEISSRATSDSNKKTKAELAFQKAKEERVTNLEVSVFLANSSYQRLVLEVWPWLQVFFGDKFCTGLGHSILTTSLLFKCLFTIRYEMLF